MTAMRIIQNLYMLYLWCHTYL